MRHLNQQWIEETEAEIRETNPTAAKVAAANCGFAVLRRPSVLTARLADGTEWEIKGHDVRQLSTDEIAAGRLTPDPCRCEVAATVRPQWSGTR